MSEFTKGPWKYAPSIPEEGVECFFVVSDEKPVADIYGGQNSENEANARLIAAAPDLLDALKSAIEWARPMEEAPRSNRPEWFDQARAALANAKGVI